MTGNLDVRWIDASPSAKHNYDPEIQVHLYDEYTVILLLVSHSHSHGDHTAGDVQFGDRPDPTVLGAGLAAVTGFGLRDWPEGTTQLDLGGRVIDVIPSPGYEEPAVTYFDRSAGLLLTGDTFYSGRPYVRDWAAFAATVERPSAFAEDQPCATCSVGTSR